MKPSHQCTKQSLSGGYFWKRSILLEEVDFIGGGVFLEEVFFLLEEVIIFGGGRFCWRRCIFLEEVFFVGGGDVCFWSRVALTGHRISWKPVVVKNQDTL